MSKHNVTPKFKPGQWVAPKAGVAFPYDGMYRVVGLVRPSKGGDVYCYYVEYIPFYRGIIESFSHRLSVEYVEANYQLAHPVIPTTKE